MAVLPLASMTAALVGVAGAEPSSDVGSMTAYPCAPCLRACAVSQTVGVGLLMAMMMGDQAAQHAVPNDERDRARGAADSMMGGGGEGE